MNSKIFKLTNLKKNNGYSTEKFSTAEQTVNKEREEQTS
jgi:hypothetical protein